MAEIFKITGHQNHNRRKLAYIAHGVKNKELFGVKNKELRCLMCRHTFPAPELTNLDET
jgi:hypothetical protein